jgi:hypothetical protein
MLKGQELLASIESMPGSTRKEIAIAAGYEKNGRAQMEKYYEAFIDAQGLTSAVGVVSTKRGKPSSSTMRLQKTGMAVVGKNWWNSIGVEIGDEVAIAIDYDSPEAQSVGPRIILHKVVVESVDAVEVIEDEDEDEDDFTSTIASMDLALSNLATASSAS